MQPEYETLEEGLGEVAPQPKSRTGLKVFGGLLAIGAMVGAGVVYGPELVDSTAEPASTSGLAFSNPWDTAFTPEGHMFITERCNGLSVVTNEGEQVKLLGNDRNGLAPDFFCEGQSGMHGVAVDPNYGVPGAVGERDIYVFMASTTPAESHPDRRTNRVMRLTMGDRITDPPVSRVDIVDDIFFKNARNAVGNPGAHSGGRIGFGNRGSAYADTLFITSGDNHNGTLPQDKWALGGKILAVDRDGAADSRNVIQAPEGDSRIFTYGIRNAQGLAFRPGTDQVYIAEHGPNHSDEVTLLRNGGNGGWDPQNRPNLNCQGIYCGYSGNPTTMPMTDFGRFPDAIPPVYNYNERSAGMGPAAFLEGEQWGRYENWLAIGIMGARRIQLLELDPEGNLVSVVTPNRIPLDRYRSLTMAPSGNLMVTTDGNMVRELTPAELLQF